MQDYVSMALLWFAVEQAKPETNFATGEEASKQIATIQSILDNALSSL